MVANEVNLISLDLSTIENDIEYLLFVEHEEDMKNYTHLKPLISELAKLTVVHADAAVRKYQREITTNLAESLKENVHKIVFGQKIKTTKIVETPTHREANYDW